MLVRNGENPAPPQTAHLYMNTERNFIFGRYSEGTGLPGRETAVTNMQVTYANRRIHGNKTVFILVTLLTCLSFVYLPVFSYWLFIEPCDKNILWIPALATLAGLILEFGLLYHGLKIIFGKLHIVADDSRITLVEKIPGFRARIKEIKISSSSYIRMDCGATHAAPSLDPVSYHITVSDAMQSTQVLSSGNYETVEELYQKLRAAFPACKAISDLSTRDTLLQQYKARVNKEKLKATRVLSFLCLWGALLTAFPLAAEYRNYKLSNDWAKTTATVTIPAQETEEAGDEFSSEVLITYNMQGKIYSERCPEDLIVRKQGDPGPVRAGSTVEIYVNPQNPEQYTLGAGKWSDKSDLMVASALFLALFIVLLRLSIQYKRFDKSLSRE